MAFELNEHTKVLTGETGQSGLSQQFFELTKSPGNVQPAVETEATHKTESPDALLRVSFPMENISAKDIANSIRRLDRLDSRSKGVPTIRGGITQHFYEGGDEQVKQLEKNINAALKGTGKEIEITAVETRLSKRSFKLIADDFGSIPEKIYMVQMIKDGKRSQDGFLFAVSRTF